MYSTYDAPTITITRVNLIQLLRDGLEVHRDLYQTQLTEYKTKAAAFIHDAAARIANDDYTNLTLADQPPVSSAPTFEAAIDVLGEAIDETFNICPDELHLYKTGGWPHQGIFGNLNYMPGNRFQHRLDPHQRRPRD